MRVYTLQLSKNHSDTIRRLSWAFNIPMTKVLSNIVELSISFMNKKMICKKCKDKGCNNCFLRKKIRNRLPGKHLILKKQSYLFFTNQ